MKTVIIKNMLRQGVPILLKNANGKLVSAILPAKGERVIPVQEMSQDLLDKAEKNIIRLDYVTTG